MASVSQAAERGGERADTDKLDELGEALLDFNSLADLEAWLERS